jgi:hypothetical protein
MKKNFALSAFAALGFAALAFSGCDPEPKVDPDSLKVTITGDGIGGTPLEIKESEAGTVPVKVTILAPQAIENFKVQIFTENPVFMGGLTGMGLNGEFDLANPGPLADALSSPLVGLPNGDAVKGKTELEFDITAFIPMIFQVTGMAGGGDLNVDFKLTVTDKANKTESATIKLSLLDAQ